MAAPYLSRLGELALGVESPSGDKATVTLTGSASKFRVFDLSWTDDPRLFDRRHYSKSLSRYPHLVGQNLAQVSGRIELRKTAATNTEDAWGPMLKACGFSFSTGVYKMTSDPSVPPTLTMYVFKGGGASAATVRSGMRGAAGSCRLEMNVGSPGFLAFTFYGIHDPSDPDLVTQADALNTITHEDAIPGTFNNATTVTYGGTDMRISSFAVDFGQTVSERQNVAKSSGVEHYVVTDRDISITIDPEVVAPGTINWRNLAHLGTESALAITHVQPLTASPSVAGKTFAFAAPKCQIAQIAEGDRNGIATMGATLKANLSAEPGDDEFTITITDV